MRRFVPAMVMTFVVMSAAVQAGGQLGKLFGGGKKDAQFKPFQPPSQRYTVDYPSKDWQVQPAGTASVVFTQKKNEATVAIEHGSLAVALDPGDINDTTAGYEMEYVKSQMPKADGFRKQVQGDLKRRVIVIDYNRPSVKGGMEQARQYSFIVGKDVYRIICSAVPAQFAKYEAVFTQMASSFKVAGTP